MTDKFISPGSQPEGVNQGIKAKRLTVSGIL